MDNVIQRVKVHLLKLNASQTAGWSVCVCECVLLCVCAYASESVHLGACTVASLHSDFQTYTASRNGKVYICRIRSILSRCPLKSPKTQDGVELQGERNMLLIES